MGVGGVAYREDTIWIDDPVYGLSMVSNASHVNATATSEAEMRPRLNGQQLYALRAIAISAACASIASGLVVGWWFVRMKRTFRHHLIMLMIFSDFFKASWQLIYPAVVFSRGAVTSNSQFCQVSGFMMSMGIEASDFAALAIAVHSALYIFRPGMGAIGEGGLFRYRYYVYAAWLCFSVLLPSLAFINHNPAYSAQGTFCYLPVRPVWYRLGLAWIPRYIIMLTIMVLYVSIYIYVRIKFRTFRTSVGGSNLDLDTIDLVVPENPPEHQRMPSLDAHGLIPPSPGPEPRTSFCDNGSNFLTQSPLTQLLPRVLLSPFGDKTSTQNSSSDSQGSDSNHSRQSSCSIPTLGARSSPPMPLEQEIAEKQRKLFEDSASKEIRRQRVNISRQLRLVFIYPIVYALMWVPPLVSHSLQFTDKFISHPSFPLHCLVAFTLPFQCFVDCWLFTIREKPWRYIPETQSTRWYARYGFWFGKCEGRSAERGAEDGGDEAWRHRKHMSFEARKAYERRDAERQEAAENLRAEQRLMAERRASGRSWWDVTADNISNDLAADDELDDPAEAGRREAEDALSRLENGRSPPGSPSLDSPISSATGSLRRPSAYITITPPSDHTLSF